MSWKLEHLFPVEESFITRSDAINVYPCPSAAAATWIQMCGCDRTSVVL